MSLLRRRSDAVLGTIVGDVVGSVYESRWTKVDDRAFPLLAPGSRPTDDTVLSLAVAEAVRTDAAFAPTLQRWARQYPHAGYGGMFKAWMAADDPQPYGSFGNGSAMRVAPIACAHDDLEVVLEVAARSAIVTHDHPDGVTGAQAVAAATLHARQHGLLGLREVVSGFGYDLSPTVEQWRTTSAFDVTCVGTVPPAVQAVLEAHDLESAVRNAVYIGGDADTLAAIAGAVAAAAFGVPDPLREAAVLRLDDDQLAEFTRFDAWLATR